MKKLLLILPLLLLLSWCSSKSSINEQWPSHINKEYNIIHNTNWSIYLNNNILIQNDLYEESWLDYISHPLWQLDSEWNYVVYQPQEDKIIGSAQYITSSKTYEWNKSFIANQHLRNVMMSKDNVAYYKCEKIMYFDDSNENSCLANQIWVNDWLVDQIDMKFLKDNRNYNFKIRYLDQDKMIYINWSTYYVYNIKTKEKLEYKELNNFVNIMTSKWIKDNIISEDETMNQIYVDFIWFKDWKFLTAIKTYDSPYLIPVMTEYFNYMKRLGGSKEYAYDMWWYEIDNILNWTSLYVDEWQTEESFWWFYVYGLDYLLSDPAARLDLYSIYIWEDIYAMNVINPVAYDNNVFYLTYRNILFEEENKHIFDVLQKTLIQSIYTGGSVSLEFSLFKDESILSSFVYKSSWSSPIYNISFTYAENTSCSMNTTNLYDFDIAICSDWINSLIRTLYLPQEWATEYMAYSTFLYNWVKLDLDKYMLDFDDLKNTSFDQAKDLVGIYPDNKSFFVFNNWLKWLLFLSPSWNEEWFSIFKKMFFSEIEEDDMMEFIADYQNLDKKLLMSLSEKSESDYTEIDREIMSQVDDFFKYLEWKKDLLHIKYNDETHSFDNPNIVYKNLDKVLWVY